ncbi:MAG: XRE family transcriptional regulator [Spartobacteria bacterium]|nr:XRE family transcriptional regulator [Spartobacteria bacterium]
MKTLDNGWVEGDVQDFLELSPADMEYIEAKMTLAHKLKEIRTSKGMTQTALANVLHTSQSRIARMEHGDPDVTIDLLMNALFTLGLKRDKLF